MTIERFEEILNYNDMQFCICERNGDMLCVEIEFESDAGEDVIELFWFNTETIADDFWRFAEDFDPDNHAERLIGVRGKHGVPESIRELIDDADWIKEKLENVAKQVMMFNKIDKEK